MQHIYSTRPIWILLTHFFSPHSLLRKKTQLLKIDSKLIIFTYWNWVWDILRERANFTHIFIWRKTKLVAALHLKALKWIIHLEPKFEYVVSIKVVKIMNILKFSPAWSMYKGRNIWRHIASPPWTSDLIRIGFNIQVNWYKL